MNRYEKADIITLALDNLNTHKPGSFYETLAPYGAKRICDRIEFIYTPKLGSWLNVAEIKLNVLIGQCLNRLMGSFEEVKREVSTWQNRRDNLKAGLTGVSRIETYVKIAASISAIGCAT